MKLRYDKNEDIISLKFSDAPYAESDEIREGVIFDYDARGKIIGMEILDASSRFPKKFHSDLLKRNVPFNFVIGEKVAA